MNKHTLAGEPNDFFVHLSQKDRPTQSSVSQFMIAACGAVSWDYDGNPVIDYDAFVPLPCGCDASFNFSED